MADKQTIVREGSTAAATGTAIGIRIPKVPQAVPVEKLRNAATRKIAAGRKRSRPEPLETIP